jgi:hypothetical protein
MNNVRVFTSWTYLLTCVQEYEYHLCFPKQQYFSWKYEIKLSVKGANNHLFMHNYTGYKTFLKRYKDIGGFWHKNMKYF